jgi:hypothetical protein
MRKIYSIVLTACAMLLSTSLFADDVTTLAELQAAIDNTAAGGTVNIRLTDNIIMGTTDMPIRIYGKYADAGKTVNLDLNNHYIQVTQGRAIELFKGTLNITGKGNINKNGKGGKVYAGATGNKEMIFVAGSWNTNDANWSNLTIGKDVNLNAEIAEGKAISINEFAFTQTSKATANYTITNPMDYIDKTKDGVSLTTSAYYKRNNVAIMDYCTDWKNYDINGAKSSTNIGKAYGVNVHIYGTVYGGEYGVKINGIITMTDGDNVPMVYIHSGAEVSSNSDPTYAANPANDVYPVAVYCSGYGKTIIEGTVHGATGVYVKGGDVTLNDAVVYSEYEDASKYKEPEATKSGVKTAGSGVVIESTGSYVGQHSVTITGDTKISGGCGYAIEETVTNAADTKVESVKVEGGTIEAGAQGAMIVDEKTAAEDAKITIVGGNLGNNLKIKDGETVTPAEVDQFFPKNDGSTYVSTTIQNADGDDVIVVTKLETGVVIDKPAAGNSNSVLGTADGQGVNWILNTEDQANPAKNTETIKDDNKELAYLEINNDYPQTLIVSNGKTLTVGRIVMGKKAQIIVEAGSKLIVEGEQGIVAPVTDNIVLKAVDQDNYAQFLFNPAVTSNRHPNATIEWVSQSFRVDANNRWNQPFGIPTAYSIKSIEADRTDHRIAFFNYNYENNKGWENIGYLYPETSSQAPLDPESLNKPFNYYQILCTSATPGTKVTMKGELVGNVNQTVNYLQFYRMGFANSYTADMDVDQILPTVPGANEALYINMRNEYGDYAWEAVSLALDKADYPTTKIAPMQAFIVLNRGAAASSEINYADFVWNPVMNPTSNAPRRINETAYDILKVTVRGQKAYDRVTLLEADRFTSALDRGEAEKYMNDGLNIYVTDENPMGIFASDNINNTYLGFNCKKSGTYTLSFEQRFDSNLALVDLKTNEVINIVEGATYEFSANENEQDDYRFQIVKRQNVVTDVETVENNMKNGGVYTLTGMYLGNMSVWNTLPAGIYVVNGEKRVK